MYIKGKTYLSRRGRQGGWQIVMRNAFRVMALVDKGLFLQVGHKDSTSMRKYLGFRFAGHFLQKFIEVDSIPLGVPARFIQRRQGLPLLVLLWEHRLTITYVLIKWQHPAGQTTLCVAEGHACEGTTGDGGYHSVVTCTSWALRWHKDMVF